LTALTKTSFHANGKLLLSGEYFVLDGAQAIGLPCNLGQSLIITPKHTDNHLHWTSKTVTGETWFEAIFTKEQFSIITANDSKTAEVLQQMLQKIQQLNPDFLQSYHQGLRVETRLAFPRLWGLGSSSTLIYNLATWAAIDPFLLSSRTLGGSGYDIACAGAKQAILYQNQIEQPLIEAVHFHPNFINQLYFIYLGKKQNSREGIKRYRAKSKQNAQHLAKISQLSEGLLKAETLENFQELLLEHEQIVAKTIQMQRAQDIYFSDFDGVIKSLGAWGGDFVLAATKLNQAKAKSYFNKKGFETFFEYKELIL